MARREIATLLRSTGLPVVYRHWVEGSNQEFPCIAYNQVGRDDFFADNKHFAKYDEWNIELYAEWKDDASEELIEQTLEDAGINYIKSEDIWIDSEQLLKVDYSIKYKH